MHNNHVNTPAAQGSRSEADGLPLLAAAAASLAGSAPAAGSAPRLRLRLESRLLLCLRCFFLCFRLFFFAFFSFLLRRASSSLRG